MPVCGLPSQERFRCSLFRVNDNPLSFHARPLRIAYSLSTLIIFFSTRSVYLTFIIRTGYFDKKGLHLVFQIGFAEAEIFIFHTLYFIFKNIVETFFLKRFYRERYNRKENRNDLHFRRART